jgi:hypothetical protein
MIYQIYPTKDATIYENNIDKNTGLDSIIEISKEIVTLQTSGIVTHSIYNSRALLKFDYSHLDALVEAGFNSSSLSNSYHLKLHVDEETQLPDSYTLEVNTISGSWTMGVGKYNYTPEIKEGVSWLYTHGTASNQQWATSSYTLGSTGSYQTEPGGATWYTASDLIVTKSYEYNQLLDAEIDISAIVRAHLSGSISNDGILIRRTTSDESSLNDTATLQYFSSDTNTIYLPKIVVKWNDWSFSTGSLTSINANDDNVVYFSNLRDSYTTDDRVKFRLTGRKKYPPKTFATSSAYSSTYYLPASSSYSIEDMHTKEVVVAHDFNYSRISCDSSGSFFNVWMSALQPERWYKFTIKSKFSNNDIRIFDDGFIFKVTRPA